jgi:glycerol-3-phosphate acyltransferase PlsY
MRFFIVIAAYLIGSIPFGLLIAGIWNVDIRRHGSGNIGATNVFRTLGPVPGTLAFALDFAKGLAAVYLGYWTGGDPLMVILLGVAAVCGHMFPVFLGFRGGKGAATGLGVLAGIAPEVFGVSLLLAAVIIFTTRYVSVASMSTACAAAILMLVLNKPRPYVLATLLVAVLIIFRHLPNIRRLLRGKEPRV